jgi:alkaline phosphatase D
VSFASPGGGTQWQRWFEAGTLPNRQGTPHTGDFADGYGNKFRVLAVANPKVTQTQFRQHHRAPGNNLGDRTLKSEGYGIVRVDGKARAFTIECWPWDVDPAAPGAKQFAGWPHRLPFDEMAGSRKAS